jgi:membrane protease subunit HflK
LAPGKLVAGVLAVLLLAGVASSIFSVPTDSEAVITRFGKYVRTAERGFQFKLPLGIEQAALVPVKRQLKMEFGFGTQGASNRYQISSEREQLAEKNMVTGDLNAVLVEWVVQYRIDDSKAYRFHVAHPEDTLRAAAESVMRSVIGDRTVDEVITVGRDEIERECLLKLRENVEEYDMGLSIVQIQLKDVKPPMEVQPSFRDVNSAQQEREEKINLARRQYESQIPHKKGTAQKLVTEAEGYATERVNEAEGDVARFKALLEEYRRSPEITKRRIYLETLGEVVPNLGNKIILDEEAGNLLPLLNLGSQPGR